MLIASLRGIALVFSCALALSVHAQTNLPGTLDPAFDPLDGPDNIVESLAVQSDGKVLIASRHIRAVQGQDRPGFARLRPDGTLDSQFNPVILRKLMTGNGVLPGSVTVVAVRPDDRLVLGGSFNIVGSRSNLVNFVMLDAEGNLDPAMTTNGVHDFATVEAIALQRDGKVLIGGHFTPGVVRVLTNGVLDPTFTLGLALDDANVTAVAQAPDGKILVATGISTDHPRGLYRFNTNGSRDNSFTGPVLTNTSMTPGGPEIRALAVQPDGKILLGGLFTEANRTARGGIVRLNANGAVDSSFVPGTGGIGTTSVSEQPTGTNLFAGGVRDIALQNDGRIILVGEFGVFDRQPNVGIVRLEANGAWDSSFGTGTGIIGIANKVALAPTNRVLVAGGFRQFAGVTRNNVARLHAGPPLVAPTPPSITEHPAPQAVRTGDSVVFAVTAGGTPPLSYQWRRNGFNLAGQTSRMLTIESARRTDAGIYSVLVTNALGSAVSSNAMLSVDGVTQPENVRPTLVLRTPATNLRVTNNAVTFAGTAADNIAVAAVQVQNGDGPLVPATGTNAWSALVPLNPGTNVIRIRAVDTSGNNSLTNSRVVVFVVTERPTFRTNGVGRITPDLNRTLLELGRNYTVTATPGAGYLFSNWVGSATSSSNRLTFTMQSNFVTTANFVRNPFTRVKGAYNGLVTCSNALHECMGFFSANVTDQGTYTGQLQLGGKRFPVAGQFDVGGHSSRRVVRPGASPLTVDLQLDFSGVGQITGQVSDGRWFADLLADRVFFHAATNRATNFAGRYTLAVDPGIDPNQSPAGSGFGTFTIDPGGMVNFAGTLADGSTIAQRVPISRGGDWPFYALLYGGKGAIVGWITNSTEGLHGGANWIKPASPTLRPYTNGFSVTPGINISRYTPPTTNRVLQLTDAHVILTDGNLTESVDNEVTLLPNNRVRNNSTNALSLVINTANGMFMGTVTPPRTRRVLAIKGVLLQNENSGAGFFIDTNRSGRVYFGP